MKKNVIYISIAIVVGLLGGWFIFGKSLEGSMLKKDNSDMSDSHHHSTEGDSQMWTCSMHPQIMQPESGDCPICGMDLIPADSGTGGLAMNEIKMTSNAMALANIQTTIIANPSADEENMISLSGKIKMNEEGNVIQASYFDGRIERLNVNFEGQKVRKGQLLATIYAPNLVAAQQELITAASLKKSQPSLYRAVRNKLKLWKLSEAQIKSIEESGEVREYFPIYATVSGTVSEKMVSEGDYVKQGQPILKLSDLNSIWAEFDAYENQISEFEEGQKIKVVTSAYPNKEFEATVSFIDPVLNSQTRIITLRAELENDEGLLKPGMFITGKVETKSTTNTSQLIIPASAVMWTGERSLVYLKTYPKEPVFEMREITLGNRLDDMFVVISGLQDGDEIVTNGTFTVDAAAQLQGKKSMMNQDINEKKTTVSNIKIELPKQVQEAFKKSLKPYLKMKDALVDGDSKSVSAFAKATLEKIKPISNIELSGMLKSHFFKIKQMLSAITENDNLEKQRNHFVMLNQNMLPILLNINDVDSKMFIQKCPMANNNQGAFWLSDNKEIRNPYYGEQMLTCGSVIDSLQ